MGDEKLDDESTFDKFFDGYGRATGLNLDANLDDAPGTVNSGVKGVLGVKDLLDEDKDGFEKFSAAVDVAEVVADVATFALEGEIVAGAAAGAAATAGAPCRAWVRSCCSSS